MRGLYLVATVGLVSNAYADFIDFEQDAVGFRGNGWSSVDSARVVFSNSLLGQSSLELHVFDFGVQSDGRALSANDSGLSGILMDFTEPMRSLSLAFGNDDPGANQRRAVLELYSGVALVKSVFVGTNNDDLMNQTISANRGAGFDSALFYYADNTGSLIGNAEEIIDNVSFQEVPTPGAVSLAALTGAVVLQRRRRP
ncbi:MAG: MYXO-CTERM sorting domain-containing protein [Planctomycetota bacterium]